MPASSRGTSASTSRAIPSIVVQNMPGAGSLKLANYLYNVAPKDGATIGIFSRGMAMEPLIGASNTQFDATKFTWLGSGTNEVSVFVVWHTSPVKTWDDMLTKPFTVGGEGSGSDPDIYALLLKNAFGAKLRLITRLSRHRRGRAGARARRGGRARELVVVEPENAEARLDRAEEGEFRRCSST